MIIKIFRELWDPIDIRQHQDMLFVYSSDESPTVKIKNGKKIRVKVTDKMHQTGQACIRREKNAMGIPARKCAGNHREAFYNDEELETTKLKITKAVDNIIAKLASQKNKYIGMVLPECGIGNYKDDGDLDKMAPKTYEYMISEINRLIRLVGKI